MISNSMVDTLSPFNKRIGNFNLVTLYNRSWVAGRTHMILSAITHRSNRLLELGSYLTERRCGHYAGKREVPLDKIRGTESRLNDFDDQFHPLTDQIQERWLSVAKANEQGINLPPVELIQVGDIYFVRDGHHRISVAKAFGQTTINANVTVY